MAKSDTNKSSVEKSEEKETQQVLNMEDIMKKFAEFQSKIVELSGQNTKLQNQVKVMEENSTLITPVTSTLESTPVVSTEKIVEALKRKSDREVTIIHNREMMGGLATVIELSNLTIQFHKLGEQRVLTWQQFEECVSRCRSLFDSEIILLEAGQEDLVEKYDIPSINRNSKYVMTKNKLTELKNMDVHELEDFFVGLTSYDKKSVLSYWMGKCYEKDPIFYDRYKLELFNRLSNSGIFDNLIAEMNNDFLRRK
jgi:hypothetical protein